MVECGTVSNSISRRIQRDLYVYRVQSRTVELQIVILQPSEVEHNVLQHSIFYCSAASYLTAANTVVN